MASKRDDVLETQSVGSQGTIGRMMESLDVTSESGVFATPAPHQMAKTKRKKNKDTLVEEEATKQSRVGSIRKDSPTSAAQKLEFRKDSCLPTASKLELQAEGRMMDSEDIRPVFGNYVMDLQSLVSALGKVASCAECQNR